ncbi:hypothetical protein Nmel_008475 [Mimus melanotis]
MWMECEDPETSQLSFFSLDQEKRR